jgi:hypothetical protein
MRPLAGDDLNGTATHVKRIGEEFDQRVVGRAFNRRRRDSHNQFVVADTPKGLVLRAGNDADVDDDARWDVSKQF